ncbi:MAG: NAD(+) synthase [Candidatus Levybacteria bacterium]|nr:NAD(+) synthase [Candidatus Levybacteria bacterium]
MDFNPKRETQKITIFIKNVLKQTNHQKVVLGLSGGIDSAVSLCLLKQSIPKSNIIVAHLYYFEPLNIEFLTNDLPKKNIHNISIKEIVDEIFHLEDGKTKSLLPGGRVERSESHDSWDGGTPENDSSEVERLRFGNIAARVRMILLYDLAKKYKGLVCGTENKSEYLLGYFTRFGDEASDFEPIRHLYKTQVYELAKYLKVPDEIIKTEPTAGLWPGQTDEKELGFTYFDADQVLNLYFDEKLNIEEIKKQGFPNAEKIIKRTKENSYKHQTPYTLE